VWVGGRGEELYDCKQTSVCLVYLHRGRAILKALVRAAARVLLRHRLRKHLTHFGTCDLNLEVLDETCTKERVGKPASARFLC